MTRKDSIRNEIIQEKEQQKETTLQKIKKWRLECFGHVTRMGDSRLPL